MLFRVPRKWYQKVRNVLFGWQSEQPGENPQGFQQVCQDLERVGDELEQRELLVRKREAEVVALKEKVSPKVVSSGFVGDLAWCGAVVEFLDYRKRQVTTKEQAWTKCQKRNV